MHTREQLVSTTVTLRYAALHTNALLAYLIFHAKKAVPITDATMTITKIGTAMASARSGLFDAVDETATVEVVATVVSVVDTTTAWVQLNMQVSNQNARATSSLQ